MSSLPSRLTGRATLIWLLVGSLGVSLAFGQSTGSPQVHPSGFRIPESDRVPSGETIRREFSEEFTASRMLRPMSETEARTLAASHSTLANLLEMEIALLECAPLPKNSRRRCEALKKRATRRRILEGAADRARQAAMGEAMREFYSLAATRANLELLVEAAGLLEDAIEEVARLEDIGLPVPQDSGALRRQRLRLLEEAVAVAGTGDGANARLVALVGADAFADIQPVIEWNVRVAFASANDVVPLALANDPQLRLLDYLLCEVDDESLATIEGFLSSIQPLVGMLREPPTSGFDFLLLLLCPPKPNECAPGVRRAQLSLYRDRKAAEVAGEARAAVAEQHSALRRLAFAREQWESLDEAYREEEADDAESPAAFAAEVEAVLKKGELAARIAAYHGARLKLDFLTGRFENEACGF